MKYSKKVREEAALICAIAASSPRLPTPYYNIIAQWLGLGPSCSTALVYAMAAWKVVAVAYDEAWTCEVDAEAEALIRTGWSP